MTETRANGQSQQEVDELRELRERERALRRRELATKAGVDDTEVARLKLLAEFIGDAYAERLGELLDTEEVKMPKRASESSRGSSRESDSETRRRIRI